MTQFILYFYKQNAVFVIARAVEIVTATFRHYQPFSFLFY